MSENRCRKEQSGQMLPSPHDPPWEHILSVEHPHLASRHNVERETRLQSKIADIDNAFSDAASGSPGTILDQQAPPKWEPYGSTSYHTDHYHTTRGNNNSLQTLHYRDDINIDASYSLPPSGRTAPASHSSPGETTESSSTMETNFPETVRSNSPLSDGPDAGPSDRSISSRPRPFSRKSKAGIEHTVTPARAGPDGGFICTFSERGEVCGKSFKLPSDIRFHLIEQHMTFSPFQCENCKRVYTRKSLYTRHLKEVSQDRSTTRKARQCPHRVVEEDEAYRIRKNTYEALWKIQLSQEEVDSAITVISQHNGKLPSRRRRTQGSNEPGMRDLCDVGLSLPVGHAPQQNKTGLHTHPATSYGSPTAVTAYSPPATLVRVCSVPNFPTHQNAVAHSAGNHKPPPVTCYSSGQAYGGITSFQGPSTVPVEQTAYHRDFLDPAHALITPHPRVPGYFESQRLSPSSDSIAPQNLQGRQSSWDNSRIGSNYEDHWASSSGAHNGHEQITFEDGTQAPNYQYSSDSHSEHIQHDQFNQTINPRRFSYQDEPRNTAQSTDCGKPQGP